MDYLVKSIKWTKNNGITTWWRPNRSGYTDQIYEAGVYSEYEAKYLEKTHGSNVCVAVPYDKHMVIEAIKQQEVIIRDCENQIERYKGYIEHEQQHIDCSKEKIKKLKDRTS